MDIYSFAKQYDYGTDYYDHNTGYTYAIQEYGRILKELNADKEDHLTAVYYGVTPIGYAMKL